VRPDGAPGTRDLRRDVGDANSLVLVLVAPILVVLLFAGWQAALWSHARAELRSVARDTAAMVARSGVDPADAEASAATVIAGDVDVRDVDVVVTVVGGIVTVEVRASAAGIIRGTRAPVAVTVAMPVEAWSSL
jgi:hypothetical protein